MPAVSADGNEKSFSGNLMGGAAWFSMLLARIPNTARKFSVGDDIALRVFGLGEHILSPLRSAGLPSIQRNGARCYDKNDLKSAALYFSTRSGQRQMLGWWARELDRPLGDAASYRVSYVIGCADGGHPGPCEFSFLTGGRQREVVIGEDAKPAERAVMTFTLRREWPDLPTEVAEVIDEVSRIRFLWIPRSLRQDDEFVLTQEIGPCESISRIIVAKARARGLRARFSRGLALTPPVGANHYWAELLIDGRWVPVDPTMIEVMLALGLLAPERWSRYKSFGGIMVRLAAGECPLALHNGVRARPRLLVRRVGVGAAVHAAGI
jgi:hypothetical protein